MELSSSSWTQGIFLKIKFKILKAVKFSSGTKYSHSFVDIFLAMSFWEYHFDIEDLNNTNNNRKELWEDN